MPRLPRSISRSATTSKGREEGTQGFVDVTDAITKRAEALREGGESGLKAAHHYLQVNIVVDEATGERVARGRLIVMGFHFGAKFYFKEILKVFGSGLNASYIHGIFAVIRAIAGLAPIRVDLLELICKLLGGLTPLREMGLNSNKAQALTMAMEEAGDDEAAALMLMDEQLGRLITEAASRRGRCMCVCVCMCL